MGGIIKFDASLVERLAKMPQPEIKRILEELIKIRKAIEKIAS
jgi:hypothetical protein